MAKKKTTPKKGVSQKEETSTPTTPIITATEPSPSGEGKAVISRDVEQEKGQDQTTSDDSDRLRVEPRKIDTPLQDNIRHFFYEHILGCIDQVDPDRRKIILDIGSRDSKWPAFLAREGHSVFCIDRWDSVTAVQQNIMKNWEVQYTVGHQDVTEMDLSQEFHFIFDIFAIQHNGNTDHDIASWIHCANMLGKGGFFTTVVKYNHTQGSIQENRSDGAMRTYSHEDVKNRIISPLESILPDLKGIIAESVLFNFQEQTIGFVDNEEAANSLWLVMQRQ